MRIVLAATGASGAIYLERLLYYLANGSREVHLVLSTYARQVIAEELEGDLAIPDGVVVTGDRTMNVPFVSGSQAFDAMVIVPCSMGTMAKVAHGIADSTITRAADVFLKEGRKLVLVPRETPWNLVHARNVVALLEAGAKILPAMPAFYSKPKNILDLVDSVVHRILDQLELPAPDAYRWKNENSE